MCDKKLEEINMDEKEAHIRVLGRVDKELKSIRIDIEKRGFTAGFSMIRRQSHSQAENTVKTMNRSQSAG